MKNKLIQLSNGAWINPAHIVSIKLETISYGINEQKVYTKITLVSGQIMLDGDSVNRLAEYINVD